MNCCKNKDYTIDKEQLERFAKDTVSQHLKEQKDAGFIQGEN